MEEKIMATVQELINQLSKIENKEQTIVFQYWLAEHFDQEPTEEQFYEASEALWADSLWQEALDTLSEEVASVIARDSEEEEEEQE
jgi:hypothetical protein